MLLPDAIGRHQAGVTIREGDRVMITTTPNTDNGWRPYREALAVGALATVTGEVRYNEHHGYYYAPIRLDREWATSPHPEWKRSQAGDVVRYWHGPGAECPRGEEWRPPTPYTDEHYPNGRKHQFWMPTDYLSAVKP